MDLHRFSYGTFTEIEIGIAEVVVDEGADIDMVMVEELHQAFLAQLPERFSLLINKKMPTLRNWTHSLNLDNCQL